MSIAYFDDANVTPAQVCEVIVDQLTNNPHGRTDALRTAVMYLPITMPAATWVAGALLAGVKENTARNRLSEVRRFQQELGEI